MDSYFVLLLLVASVSCHNWYKGPRHFVLDIVQPGPFIGRGGRSEIPSGIDPVYIDSIRLPAEAFSTGGPSISSIGPTAHYIGEPDSPGISSAEPDSAIDISSADADWNFIGGSFINPDGEPDSAIEISSADTDWNFSEGPVIDHLGVKPGSRVSFSITTLSPSASIDTAHIGPITDPIGESESAGSTLRHGPTMDPLGVNIDGGYTYTNIGNVISGGSIIPGGSKVGTKVFLRHGAKIDPIGGYYISQSGGYLKGRSGLHRIGEGNGFYKLGGDSLYPLGYSKHGQYTNTYLPGTKGTKWFKGAEKFLHFYRTQHKRGTSSGYNMY